MTDGLKVTVLGAASCTPEPGKETASFCINGSLLVDTGWCAALQLIKYGIEPMDIEAVLMTHCHHDHYMGLVSLLFYQGLHAGRTDDEKRLAVYGPVGEIGRVVTDVWRLLQTDRYPHLEIPVDVHEVAGGDAFDVCGLSVRACRALHNVPSLHYRLETPSGASVTFSGDTPYNPALVEFARDTDLLIHEASHGPQSTREAEEPAHSGAPDAAQVASLAGAKRLGLVHIGLGSVDDALSAAREQFGNTFVPTEGDVLEL